MTITRDRSVTDAAAVPAQPRHLRRNGRSEFRGDIQGLRAVAVLLVLGFHAGVPALSGGFVGVDVFFVISGFLITGLIVREIERTGRLSLSRFWARRVRRLLPATAIVLVAVAAMTLAVLPFTRWGSIAWDVLTSATYVVNWRFADQSVNYLVSDDAPSPVQHFWSLAVEEQFYVVWPLLILVLLWVHRRTGWAVRRTLLVGITLIAVPSLWWSIRLTEDLPGQAYFVSTTRVWELAIGAILALTAHRLVRAPRVLAHVLGWLGLAAIAAAAVLIDESTPFPGSAALLPTLGAAAVLASGSAHPRNSASRLLGVAPMRDVGTLSYSLYLWHWPLLVGAAALWGRDDGSLWLPMALLVVGFSVVPAWFTYRVVEAPIHHARVFARPLRALALALVCTALGAGGALVVSRAIPEAPSYASDEQAPGAAVLTDGQPYEAPDRVEAMVPDVLSAKDDVAFLDGERCIQDIEAVTPEPCRYGPADAETTLAVLGDSKMQQWLPALEAVADEHGWQLLTYLKDACPAVQGSTSFRGDPYPACDRFNEARFAAVTDDPAVDVVLTSQRANAMYSDDLAQVETRRAMMRDDLVDSWTGFERAGKDVVVVLDNPSPGIDVMECVAQHPDDLSACSFDRTDGERESGAVAQREALRQLDDVATVDLTDAVCPGERCPAVIGDVLVYQRGTHLTATYVRSLTPRLDAALTEAVG